MDVLLVERRPRDVGDPDEGQVLVDLPGDVLIGRLPDCGVGVGPALDQVGVDLRVLVAGEVQGQLALRGGESRRRGTRRAKNRKNPAQNTRS